MASDERIPNQFDWALNIFEISHLPNWLKAIFQWLVRLLLQLWKIGGWRQRKNCTKTISSAIFNCTWKCTMQQQKNYSTSKNTTWKWWRQPKNCTKSLFSAIFFSVICFATPSLLHVKYKNSEILNMKRKIRYLMFNKQKNWGN